MIIPAEITAKHGVRQENVFRNSGPDGEGKKAMEDAVFEFATRANDHLITARDTFKETGGAVPKDAVPIFLAAVGGIHVFSFSVLIAEVLSRSLLHCSWKNWKLLILMHFMCRCKEGIGSYLGEYGGVFIRGRFESCDALKPSHSEMLC